MSWGDIIASADAWRESWEQTALLFKENLSSGVKVALEFKDECLIHAAQSIAYIQTIPPWLLARAEAY